MVLSVLWYCDSAERITVLTLPLIKSSLSKSSVDAILKAKQEIS